MALKLFTVAQMIAAEKAADTYGISYAQMMESAGKAVADAIIDRYPVSDMRVLVLVGPGNNGGDGLVAGYHLAQAGADVGFYLTKPRDPATDENFARVLQVGLFAVDANFDQRFRVLRTRLRITNLVIDALLGTGVSRPITGELAALMKQVQQGIAEVAQTAVSPSPSLTSISHTPTPNLAPACAVVAVDCPSGLHCDSGDLDPLTLPAALTVTFAGPKPGHFLFPGAAVCGDLLVADINIPPTLPEVADIQTEVATTALVRGFLPQRPLDGHKGTFGRALIAAGSSHYWGAPLLAARAAYRVGAGLVALAVPQALRAPIAGQLPEATYPPMSDADHLTSVDARTLLANMKAYKALLIGPGLGQAADFLLTLLAETAVLPPLVIDADGLNILAQQPDWPQTLPPKTILTPHPGEMARLLGIPLSELKARNRITLAQEVAQTWGHILILKGAYTVVAAPDGRCAIIPFAEPVLGTAGSGDVLAGMIVGLLAQGGDAWQTAVLAAYWHGAAGHIASQQLGHAGLLAGEITDWLPKVDF